LVCFSSNQLPDGYGLLPFGGPVFKVFFLAFWFLDQLAARAVTGTLNEPAQSLARFFTAQ